MASSNCMNSEDSKNSSVCLFHRMAQKQSRKHTISPHSAPTRVMEVRAGQPWRQEKPFPL